MSRILGLILAGGKATRFGGGDKSLRLLNDRPLLAHTDERLRPQVDAIALSANGDPARFAAFDMQVLADPEDLPDAGPVAGLMAGLAFAARDGFDYLLVVPCDAPFFPTDLAARLMEAMGDLHVQCARALSDGQAHPVFSLWRISALPTIKAESEKGIRALWRLQSSLQTADVAFDAIPFDPFQDADTAEDLARLEALSRTR